VGTLGGSVARLLLCAACLTTASCAWLDSRQRALALRPTPAANPSFDGLRPGDVVFSRQVPGESAVADRIQLWWLPHPDPRAPVLLYLHGSFRNLFQNLPKIDALREAGFAILALDYRGWGESTPIIPTEETIHADARVAWRELSAIEPDPRRRVIFGHSLGSAVAVDLASSLACGSDYAALILESSFTSLPDVAAAAGFWGRIGARLTTLSFDSRAKIAGVDAPILMLHGEADRTVPIALGRELRDAALGQVTWIEVSGGPHSRLHSFAPDVYRQAMRRVIERIEAETATAPESSRDAAAPATAR
jgi:pimeloyl-ACP methyl ester carboxylesterase